MNSPHTIGYDIMKRTIVDDLRARLNSVSIWWWKKLGKKERKKKKLISTYSHHYLVSSVGTTYFIWRIKTILNNTHLNCVCMCVHVSLTSLIYFNSLQLPPFPFFSSSPLTTGRTCPPALWAAPQSHPQVWSELWPHSWLEPTMSSLNPSNYTICKKSR